MKKSRNSSTTNERKKRGDPEKENEKETRRGKKKKDTEREVCHLLGVNQRGCSLISRLSRPSTRREDTIVVAVCTVGIAAAVGSAIAIVSLSLLNWAYRAYGMFVL
jgi:hypothetical protein